MGESYVIANLDKKQFIDPFRLGDGGKLPEFVLREDGPTNVAVALLLSKPSKLSTGELPGGLVGSWYGNRIAFVGLYDELFDVITGMGTEGYANISLVVVEMVRAYLRPFNPPVAP